MPDPDLFLFVSHVSEDRQAALEIVDELEQRGVPCWIAPRDVRPGKPFDDEIAEAIEASRAMLLIFSDRCNEHDYIRREITVAGESRKVIIPFRIEDAQPRRGLRVRLSDLHWIDGFVSRERAIDQVVRTIDPARVRQQEEERRRAEEEGRQHEEEQHRRQQQQEEEQRRPQTEEERRQREEEQRQYQEEAHRRRALSQAQKEADQKQEEKEQQRRLGFHLTGLQKAGPVSTTAPRIGPWANKRSITIIGACVSFIAAAGGVFVVRENTKPSPTLIPPLLEACAADDKVYNPASPGQDCVKLRDPKIRVYGRNISVDLCLAYEEGCGPPLFDWYCQHWGYSRAVGGKSYDSDETYVFGNGQNVPESHVPHRGESGICLRSIHGRCDGLQYIDCAK
jgi:hypothetical protein